MWGWMILYRTLKGCSCGSRGFLEDRMMDIITVRALLSKKDRIMGIMPFVIGVM